LREEHRPTVDAQAEIRVQEFLERRKSEIAEAAAERERLRQEQQQQQAEGEGSDIQLGEEPAEPDLEAEAESERQSVFDDIMSAKISENEALNALNNGNFLFFCLDL
jgi:hypothetical protein